MNHILQVIKEGENELLMNLQMSNRYNVREPIYGKENEKELKNLILLYRENAIALMEALIKEAENRKRKICTHEKCDVKCSNTQHSRIVNDTLNSQIDTYKEVIKQLQ